MMQLSVKTLDSLTHNFTDLDEEITVVQFKSHISSTVTLAPEQQRLIFRGRVLQDDKKLRDYNVTSGQVIHLVARNPTESSPANDHPQPQLNTQNAGGGGRNNAIIMGTIGTLEFSNTGNPNTTTRRRNSAAVRLSVANQCLTRASNLLQTLEEEVTLLQPQRPEDSESDDDAAMLESIALQHAATTATVMATVHQGPPPQPLEAVTSNITGTGANIGATNMDATNESTAEGPASTESGYATPNTGNSTPRPESPMLRELAVSLSDVIALNTRLMPYLQTVQRWLTENGDLGQNEASIQYTYNTVSSILHSVSHSIHALSDITVDFSLPPAQRRLRAPTTVWVEQAPVMRATIPLGVHVGVETNNLNAGPTGAPPNPPPGGMPQQQQQIIAQGILPGGGGMQIQQVISNLIQGVMSGQIQAQQQPMNINLNGSGPPPPQAPPQNINNNNSQPLGGTPAPQRNQFSRIIGAQGIQLPFNIVGAPGGPGIPFPNSQSASAPPQNAAEGTTPPAPPGGIPLAMNFQQRQPLQGGQFHSLGSLPQRTTPRLEHMILQCRSHHYGAPPGSNAPPPTQRPENLTGFLSQEARIPVGEETQVFETVTSLIQGLNLVHPILSQYIRASILRGRDCNNPGHVTTGVRVYARRLVDWIVTSISSSRTDFDSALLTTKLVDVVTQLMSKATQVILVTPSAAPVTPALGLLLNELMPKVLEALQTVFPAPDHLRIFKGIILLIVNTCFPETSVMFSSRLAAGISEYLIACQPSPPEPEVEMSNIEAEVSMEIDVEFGDAVVDGGASNTSTEAVANGFQNNLSSVSVVPSTSAALSAVPPVPSLSNSNVDSSDMTTSASDSISESRKDEVGRKKRQFGSSNSLVDSDDDEEGLRSQLRGMTDTLFRGLPEEWHETLLMDVQRQEGIRQGSPPSPSSGFLSIFPQK